MTLETATGDFINRNQTDQMDSTLQTLLRPSPFITSSCKTVEISIMKAQPG